MVLINTKAGTAFQACKGLNCIEGIERAHVVTGPYDIIAIVAPQQNISLRCLLASICDVPGVKRTETCIAVS